MNEAAEVRQIILISGQMDDALDADKGALKVCAIGNVAFDELGFARQVLRFAARMDAGLQVIENAHLIAAFKQQINRVRADESGTARYQNFAFHTISKLDGDASIRLNEERAGAGDDCHT